MREIIETFKVEGFYDYTRDDIMKRIQQLEEEKAMTLQQFIENLKTYEIANHNDYHKVWSKDETFKDLRMPRFYDSISGFSWKLINDDNYYDSHEIIDVITEIYENNLAIFDKLNDQNDILNKLHELDNNIPCEFPWIYYNLDKDNFSFIYDETVQVRTM